MVHLLAAFILQGTNPIEEYRRLEFSAKPAHFHDGWKSVTGEELSRELSEAILIAKNQVERKYAVLNRLYPGLAAMLFLAALLIVVLAALPSG